ncbi:hypothetical protein [Streptomyces sp. SID13031]|uniref:hypothetical protein n=1 Tax=Streptomyces sp. SID13031 TaxID=2706046 RepID=UPI0013C7B7CB|nr:hypothetical protein [Streptomyces sp. SID13031]NEA36144.1 hypothetical protein [Streptomyces sp. SID13031]
MQVTRKIAAAAAVATVATLGLATVVSANMIDDNTKATGGVTDASALKGYSKGGKVWYFVRDNGSLVNVDDNNVGPFQACHNVAAVNGIGGAVPVSDVVAIVGLFNDGNQATVVKTCEQGSKQNNHGGKWYRVGDDGLVSVSRNNVGPFQACHNDVAANVIGGAVPVNSIAGVLGLDNDDNTTDILKTCEQDSEQDN